MGWLLSEWFTNIYLISFFLREVREWEHGSLLPLTQSFLLFLLLLLFLLCKSS